MTQAEIEYELEDVAPESKARVATRVGGRRHTLALGWCLPVLLLGVWALAADRGWAPPQLLPAPGLVLGTWIELATSGEVFMHLGISLARVLAGFALGALLGAGLGTAMGLSRRTEQYLHPLFKALNQVPVLGWLPLAMMVFGIGESLKLVIIAQASLVPVALNVQNGIRRVPVAYSDVARIFQLTRLQTLRKVVFPAAVPSLFVGVRYGLTLAWLSLVTVELLASSEGLGFLIVWGRQLFQLDLVLAAIISIGVVGLALDRGLAQLEARLLRWRPDAAFARAGSGAG